MSKHTEGPWPISWDSNGLGYIGSPNCTVAYVLNPPAGDQEANARLIAAAPDLLALLQECRDFFENCPSYDGAETNNLDTRCMDAIAKATGEQA